LDDATLDVDGTPVVVSLRFDGDDWRVVT